MKNLKKLFVVLPLVLVMLFAALPVAALNTYYVNVAGDTLALSLWEDDVTINALKQETNMVPVWAAEKTTYANRGMYYQGRPEGSAIANSEGAGWIKLLNGGLPVGWLEANLAAVTPLQIGTAAVEQLEFFTNNGYVLPSYNINHVEVVATDIRVPVSYTRPLFQNYFVYKNQHKMIAKNETLTADQVNKLKDEGLRIGGGFAYWKNQKVAVEMNKTVGTKVLDTVTVSEVENTDTACGSAKETKFYQVETNKAGLVVTEKYTADQIKNALTAAGFSRTGKKAEDSPVGVWEQFDYDVISYTFRDDIYEFEDKENVTNLVDFINKTPVPVEMIERGHVVTARIKSARADKGVQNVNVYVGKEVDEMTDAVLNGILVIVEKGSVDVNIKHHYVLASGSEEIVKEDATTISKYEKVDENTIPMAWLQQVEGFEYDPTRTVVEQKFDDQTLTSGEKFNAGYNVDLFYVAAAEDEDGEIDAAFGNTAAGVENQGNVANLPATGAASNVAVILSSVALVVVGLFLKK